MNTLYPPLSPERNSTKPLGQARTLTPLVVVHGMIADAYRSSESALWYYLRFLDLAGTGIVEFVITEACEALEVSRMTIGRWLESGVCKGFFRAVKRSYGRATVYLAARDVIAARLGLERLGATARVPISRLQHIKLTATEIVADALQSCSHYAMREQLKAQDPRRAKFANKLDDVFVTASDSSTGATAGHVIHVGKRCAFVDEHFTVFGASQEGIAGYMGRSPHTIRRRLSNAHRTQRRKPAPLVLKRQLAQLHPELSSPAAMQDLAVAKHELRSPELSRFFSFTQSDKVKAFYALTNLYYCKDVEATSTKAGKWRYKNYVRKLQGLPPQTSSQGQASQTKAKPVREGRERSKSSAKSAPTPVSTVVETLASCVKPSSLIRTKVPALKQPAQECAHHAYQCVYGCVYGVDPNLDRDLELTDLEQKVN